MESTNDAIYILDLEGDFTLVNQQITELTGYRSEELLGFPFSIIFPPEHSRNIKTFFLATLSHGVAIKQYETELVRKDGTRKAISLNLTPSINKGKISAIVCTAEVIPWHQQPLLPQQGAEIANNLALEYEVQERTLQLQQVLDFEALLKRITDKVRDSLDESQIVQVAVKELALGLNVGCCNMALYNLEEGTSTICYEHAVSIPASQGRISQMSSFPELYNQLLQNQYFQFCSLLPHPQRDRVAMLACPVADDQGVMGDLWLVNEHDHVFNKLEIRLVQQVSNQCAIAIRQARLYQASLAQVQKLERLNQLKDDFLSTISHELRTPITTMILAIRLLQEAQSTEQQQLYLGILKAECAREARLIDDLLDLQHLEAISCESVGLNLNEWVPSIIQPFEPLNRHHQIQVELPPNLPMLHCDPTLLEQILTELLNNASKYTPSTGEISLSVCHEQSSATSDSTPAIIFAVTNQAEIPADELPHIFKNFYRGSNATSIQGGGTGLGLALVKRRVQQLRATIQAESRDGWTTFTLCCPTSPPQ